MQIVHIADIVVPARQRSKHEPRHIRELRDSILKVGLLHPPVVHFVDGTPHLIVGEGRLQAVALIQVGPTPTFRCDSTWIPPGSIPVTTLSDELTPADRFEAELDENLRRSELSWQDRCKALADLHALRSAENPSQTVADTTRELIDRGIATSGGDAPATSSRQIRANLTEAIAVARNLADPAIAKARTANEAYNLLLRREQDAVEAAIARRQTRGMTTRPDIEVRLGDSRVEMPLLDPGQFDLLLTDPPYGLDADSSGYRQRTVLHHNYTDSVDNARTMLKLALREGFRVTKPRANMFVFTDIQHWDWLQTTSAQAGWTPFRTPLIWQKSESEGLAPWGSSGPRRTYDLIFYATKGDRGLVSSPTDVFTVKRVPRHERLFAAEKPVDLLVRLIECSTLPGDVVLDPCCGSGSTLVACRETRRRGLGFEIDRDIANTATANVARPIVGASHDLVS